MFRVNSNAEILQRTTKVSDQSTTAKKLTSEDLQRQTAEFLKRGGNVTEFPIGLPSDPHLREKFLNNQQKAALANEEKSPFVNTGRAADILGVSINTMRKLLKSGELKIKTRCTATNQNLLSRTDVLAYKTAKGN